MCDADLLLCWVSNAARLLIFAAGFCCRFSYDVLLDFGLQVGMDADITVFDPVRRDGPPHPLYSEWRQTTPVACALPPWRGRECGSRGPG